MKNNIIRYMSFEGINNVKHIQLFSIAESDIKEDDGTTTSTKKKKITETNAWKKIKEEEFFTDNQWKMINDAAKYYKYIHPHSNIHRRNSDSDTETATVAHSPPPHYSLIISQIQHKLYGYKNQDILKNKYNAEKFITIDGVFNLFLREDMRCYYCHKIVLLLYEFIREQKQWTLDRIDNTFGHNNDNLYLACLSCNLRRRCLYPEKYVMTQKCMKVIRLPGAAAAVAETEDSSATTTETNSSSETTPTVRSRSPSFAALT